MKTLALMLIFAVAALFGGTPASQAQNVNCSNTALTPLVGVTKGNVTVRSGQSCTIGSAYEGAFIDGNVQVQQGGSLTIQARQYPSTVTGNVQATQCAAALLEGAVTVGGNVQITQCAAESGFNGPGTKIGGNFQCTGNSGACDATLGLVSGNAQIQSNASSSPSNISLTEIHGNLQCQANTPAPQAAFGGNWVNGNLQGQCTANLGFTWSATPPTCTALAALLAKVPYIISTATTNDGTTYNPVTAVMVAGTASTPSYCNVQLTYSAIGSPGSSAPLTDVSYGYGTNENQAIKIGIGLPLNAADFGACSANCGTPTPGWPGAWNGRLQHIGGGGLVGTVGSTTSATNFGYVGSSTDTGHSTAQNGSEEGDGNFGVTGNYMPTANATVPTTPANTLDVGKLDDYIIEGIHEQVELGKLIPRIYYGEKWAYNYWNGCSTGGRQGLELATHYGDEFDGLITGAPAFFHDRFRRADAWPYLVNQYDLLNNGFPGLTTALWTAVSNAVVSSCQANNPSGAVGYLDDPRACTVTATSLVGKIPSLSPASATFAAQAAAIDKIWAGPHNSSGYRNWHFKGKGVAFPGVTQTTGSDWNQVMSWDHASTTVNVSTPPDLYDNDLPVPTGDIPYANEAALGAKIPGPPWSLNSVPLPVAVDDILDSITPYFGVEEVNLDLILNNSQFDTASRAKKSGKIMMWQGTADQLIHSYDSIDYYRLVAVHYNTTNNSPPNTATRGDGTADFDNLQAWFRYYHAPGAFHCATGTGPAPTGTGTASTNIFNQLVGWVENSASPDPVPTTGGTLSACTGAGTPTAACTGAQPSEALNGTPFMPPLCPWPKSAVYTPTAAHSAGNDPASFTCAGNLDANNPTLQAAGYGICQMLRTPYGMETSSTLNYSESGISPAQCPGPQ